MLDQSAPFVLIFQELLGFSLERADIKREVKLETDGRADLEITMPDSSKQIIEVKVRDDCHVMDGQEGSTGRNYENHGTVIFLVTRGWALKHKATVRDRKLILWEVLGQKLLPSIHSGDILLREYARFINEVFPTTFFSKTEKNSMTANLEVVAYAAKLFATVDVLARKLKKSLAPGCVVRKDGSAAEYGYLVYSANGGEKEILWFGMSQPFGLTLGIGYQDDWHLDTQLASFEKRDNWFIFSLDEAFEQNVDLIEFAKAQILRVIEGLRVSS